MVLSERGLFALRAVTRRSRCRTAGTFIALVFLGACTQRDPVALLAKVKLAQRPIEARLSGGFQWAPMSIAVRERQSGIDAALTAAVAETLVRPAESAAASEHARALAHVLMNRPGEAVSALAVLVRTHG